MPLGILFCTQLFLLTDTAALTKTALLFFLVMKGIYSYFKQFYKMKTTCKTKVTYYPHTWRYLLLTPVCTFFQNFTFRYTVRYKCEYEYRCRWA